MKDGRINTEEFLKLDAYFFNICFDSVFGPTYLTNFKIITI